MGARRKSKRGSRGWVLPFYKYVGPGNTLNRGRPVNKADWAARIHDKAYTEILRKGRRAYTRFNEADAAMLRSVKGDYSFGGLAARGTFGLKKLITKHDVKGHPLKISPIKNSNMPGRSRSRKRINPFGGRPRLPKAYALALPSNSYNARSKSRHGVPVGEGSTSNFISGKTKFKIDKPISFKGRMEPGKWIPMQHHTVKTHFQVVSGANARVVNVKDIMDVQTMDINLFSPRYLMQDPQKNSHL